MSFLRITVITENTVKRSRLLGEHGLAYWIETADARILFDTGQAIAFQHNVEALSIPLYRTHAIVLSHGHYDHAGGLGWAMQQAFRAKLFLHPDARQDRFSLKQGTAHAIGMPADVRSVLHARGITPARLAQPMQVAPSIFVTGPIPRQNDFEDTGGPFFLDAGGRQPDPINDDQALWIDTPEGVVVLLGCAHAGIVNTLDYIRRHTQYAPIRAVIGGMHLVTAAEARLRKTVEYLRRDPPQNLAPMHCTGWKATLALWQAFPGHCRETGAGTVMEFE